MNETPEGRVAVELGELGFVARQTGAWAIECADRFGVSAIAMNESLAGWSGRSAKAMERMSVRWDETGRRLVEHVATLSGGFQLAHFEFSDADDEGANAISPSGLLNLD